LLELIVGKCFVAPDDLKCQLTQIADTALSPTMATTDLYEDLTLIEAEVTELIRQKVLFKELIKQYTAMTVIADAIMKSKTFDREVYEKTITKSPRYTPETLKRARK
jgi:hypothetical protein